MIKCLGNEQMGVEIEGGRCICLSDKVSGEHTDGSGDEGVGVFVCRIKCLWTDRWEW